MARKLYNRSNTQNLMGASVSKTPIFERTAAAPRAKAVPKKNKFTSWLDGLLTTSTRQVELPWQSTTQAPTQEPKTNQAPTGTPIIPGGHSRTTRARPGRANRARRRASF